MKKNKWPQYTGGIGAAAILSVQATMSLSHTQQVLFPLSLSFVDQSQRWGAFDSAKNHKRQRRKRQSVTAKREKSQTPKFV